jgi:hypothetical protein
MRMLHIVRKTRQEFELKNRYLLNSEVADALI